MFKLLSSIIKHKLVTRYGIHVNPLADIGIGLKIIHPMSINIADCTIGKNFTCFQNCTVGTHEFYYCGKANAPKIGDNCTLFANSLIIGSIKVGDNVTIGANSLLLKDAVSSGIYVGSPAKKVNK